MSYEEENLESIFSREDLDSEDLDDLIDTLHEAAVVSLLEDLERSEEELTEALPNSPLEAAQAIDTNYRERAHLAYLSERLAQAVKDVENGKDRFLMVSMPPRSGKSRLSSVFLPVWLLAQHPDWKIGLISHNPTLAVDWGKEVRSIIETEGSRWNVSLAKDSGAASDWSTTMRGEVRSRSAPGQSITGLGFKVLIIDDVVKDFASAHSETARKAVWEWWQANARTRLEPPSLTVVIGTRWHEDDFIGRLTSLENGGDKGAWEVITLPAIAEKDDAIGRSPGEPLISPLQEETSEQALARWAEIRESVGSYNWNALYQQRPSPPEGAIFNAEWWGFWTRDPNRVTEDGKVMLLPEEALPGGMWLDSWDLAFKGAESSDWVVGQRWVRLGANRLLIAQQRGRWSFTETLAQMLQWTEDDQALNPYGQYVYKTLVEDAANGPAIISTLKEKVSGIIPVTARNSKEARARAITPEIESGHVYIPHPEDPGNEWVADFLSELQNFPNDAHDDQVDALSQGLGGLRTEGRGGIVMPGESSYMTSTPQVGGVGAHLNALLGGDRLAAQRTTRR